MAVKAQEPERQQALEPAKAPKPPAAIPEVGLPKTPPGKAAGDFIDHVVIPGETMATIAKWYAGDTTLWPAIAQHNPGLKPFKLKGGEVVKVPIALATAHTEQPETPPPPARHPGRSKKYLKDRLPLRRPVRPPPRPSRCLARNNRSANRSVVLKGFEASKRQGIGRNTTKNREVKP